MSTRYSHRVRAGRKPAAPVIQFICISLCFGLILTTMPESFARTEQAITVEELHRMYPGATLIQVDAAEFAAVTGRPGVHTVELSTNSAPPSYRVITGHVESVKSPYTIETSDPDPQLPAKPKRPERTRGSGIGTSSDRQMESLSRSCVSSFDIFSGCSGGGNSSELAVIIFVVVGVVVVAAAFVYTGYFMYDAITGSHAPGTGWIETGTRARVFYGSSRSGGMYGVRLGSGFTANHSNVGLMVEGGYIHGKVAVREDNTPVSVSGAYGMLGPTIRWILDYDVNPPMIEVELLAGTSTDRGISIISHAAMGFSWGMGDNWRMGISIGSLYIDIRETEGPLHTKSKFNLTGGMHFGRNW